MVDINPDEWDRERRDRLSPLKEEWAARVRRIEIPISHSAQLPKVARELRKAANALERIHAMGREIDLEEDVFHSLVYNEFTKLRKAMAAINPAVPLRVVK